MRRATRRARRHPLPERRALLTGDVLGTLDVMSGRTGTVHQPVLLGPPPRDRVARSLDATIVLPGHGEPFDGTPGQAAAEAARAWVPHGTSHPADPADPAAAEARAHIGAA